MKIALITDQHFGARSDNIEFDNFFKEFYSKCFFPELKKRNITQIICLGDTFDRRKYVNFNTLKNCRSYYFDEIKNNGMMLTMLVGNHDVFFKNTNAVNSPKLLLSDYHNIKIIDSPMECEFDSLKILMLPWICAENERETFELVDKTKAEICFGHLELCGFSMYKNQIMEEGMDSSLFNKFDMVMSGHYHHRSSKKNIHYLGNPYELTWSDYDDPRGFHIFDTETRTLEFITNPFNMFIKIEYDESDMPSVLPENVKNKFIKIIVKKKTNQVKFDLFFDSIEKCNPIEVQIIDTTENLELQNDDIINEAEDTMTILSKYCSQFDEKVDKTKLENLLRTLYNEALNMEGD